ncbi:MAG: ROK family protein, partial [Lachnospiraceae bacterium]|nr:ROK family protein [Lachnospiraceae bacterium]
MLLGGIEAGGTKMVCAVATEEGRLLERVVIPTGTPENTIPLMLSFFKKWEPAALGIGTFGPVNLDRKSAGYGYIMKTPKKEWAHYDLMGAFREALQIPVGIDTDVNAAVLAEVVWGAARDCSTALYITVGTGVGVGVYCNGGLLHGLVHPEAGHILLSRHPQDQFPGVCPFHDNCLEGLASGPALEKRWGRPAGELSDRSEVWEL